MVGSINLILGPMFSGKTTELINRYNRYMIGGKKCLMIKYIGDDRYDQKMIVTHNNIRVDAISCKLLGEYDDIVKNYNVVCIDEIQFYEDADLMCDKWANDGIIIEACGLNGTFNRTEFKVISKLIPLIENLTYVKAICKHNGNDAHYSHLSIDKTNINNSEIIIGGNDKYDAYDRYNFIKANNIIFDKKKYLTRLLEIYKINDIDPIDVDNLSCSELIDMISSYEN